MLDYVQLAGMWWSDRKLRVYYYELHILARGAAMIVYAAQCLICTRNKRVGQQRQVHSSVQCGGDRHHVHQHCTFLVAVPWGCKSSCIGCVRSVCMVLCLLLGRSIRCALVVCHWCSTTAIGTVHWLRHDAVRCTFTCMSLSVILLWCCQASIT